MTIRDLRTRAANWCLVAAAVCLLLMTNVILLFPYIFRSTAYGLLGGLALVAALISLLLGTAAIPRWQSFISLAVALFALWWLLTGVSVHRVI